MSTSEELFKELRAGPWNPNCIISGDFYIIAGEFCVYDGKSHDDDVHKSRIDLTFNICTSEEIYQRFFEDALLDTTNELVEMILASRGFPFAVAEIMRTHRSKVIECKTYFARYHDGFGGPVDVHVSLYNK